MKKIIIKIPRNKKGKFKLQSQGNFAGRQFITAGAVLVSLNRYLLGTELKEKLAIVVKEYISGLWVNVNESLDSDEPEYLIYCTTCFLEDYISKRSLTKAEKKWTIFLNRK
jgi:hypothetical protein